MDVAVLPGVHAPEELIGKILDNRYRLIEQLGEGGMGSVYRAEHILLGEQVAVKILSPRFAYDRDWVQRFLVEARASRRIHHPNVVQIVDVAVAGPGIVYMVLELLAGETLSQLFRREGPLPWRRALKIAGQIASALAAAHACGIVHRDIKPSNCMLTAGADADIIKVLDFGIAKFVEARDSANAPQTITGLWLGTAEYMSPEMFRGERAAASMDIYALGVLIYKLLTGETPFRGNHMEVAMQQQQRVPAPPSEKAALPVPPAVDALVLRALARDAAGRTPDMAAVMAEITTALANPTGVMCAVVAVAAVAAVAEVAEPEPEPRSEDSHTTERARGVTFFRRNLSLLLTVSALFWVAVVSLLVLNLDANGPEQPVVEAPADLPAPVVSVAPIEATAIPPAPALVVVPEPTDGKASQRKKKGAAAKRKKSDRLADFLKVPVLRAELEAQNRTIQDKCFRPNRAIAGTRVQMDVVVDGAGAATVRLATPKYAVIGECIGYWVRRHVFTPSRTGGKIQHVFIAE